MSKIIHSAVQYNRPQAATESSPVIDLEGCSNYAVQCVYAASPAAKTFDSKAKALLVINDLTFTAVAFGVAGNSITVEYVAGGTAGDESVTVTGNAIVVEIDDTAVTGSTSDQVKAAVNADAAAALLVLVSGSGSTVQAVEAEAPLAGGRESELDLTLDTMSIPTHGFTTGLRVQASTTGTLPTGITTSTDYWVIRNGADSIKLASSLANADAGTQINLTAEGSGVHTLTATAGSLAHSLQLQKSCDGTNWQSEGSATAISAAGNTMYEGASKGYRFLRVTNTVTTGQAVYSTVFNAKG